MHNGDAVHVAITMLRNRSIALDICSVTLPLSFPGENAAPLEEWYDPTNHPSLRPFTTVKNYVCQIPERDGKLRTTFFEDACWEKVRAGGTVGL